MRGIVENRRNTGIYIETAIYRVNTINTLFYYSLYIEVVTPPLKLRYFPPAKAY